MRQVSPRRTSSSPESGAGNRERTGKYLDRATHHHGKRFRHRADRATRVCVSNDSQQHYDNHNCYAADEPESRLLQADRQQHHHGSNRIVCRDHGCCGTNRSARSRRHTGADWPHRTGRASGCPRPSRYARTDWASRTTGTRRKYSRFSSIRSNQRT